MPILDLTSEERDLILASRKKNVIWNAAIAAALTELLKAMSHTKPGTMHFEVLHENFKKIESLKRPETE